MKRSWLLATSTVVAACSAGTPAPSESAREHALRIASSAGIRAEDMPALERVAELRVDGGTVTRLAQVIEGVPVYHHELRTLVRDDGSVTSTGRVFSARMERSRPRFVDDERAAIAKAARGRRVEDARARQVWYPLGERLVAAWVVEAYTSEPRSTTSELHRTIISGDGDVLADENLTVDAFTYKVFAETTGDKHPLDGPTADATPHPTGVPDGSYPATISQSLVTIDSLVSTGDPWLAADATTTSGNNVDAYADVSAPSGLGDGDFRATASSGVFDHDYDTTLGPLASQEQQMASVTSLFYSINWLHDFWYEAGFDEEAGNAQALNYGRGGVEGDVLLAEAQDNAYGGSRNNANMSTPDDGMSPRMQVYLWSGRDTRQMTLSPSGRTPLMGGAVYGPSDFDVTASIALGVDGMGDNPTDGCTALTSAVTGALVLVDRGNCTFRTKTINAQSAGAVGVIIANNTTADTPPTLGDDPDLAHVAITIPSVSITQAEGTTIKAEIAAGTVEATILRQVAPELDGALDATLVAHEFGHYLHHRLAFCGNAMCRALSEGWGDFTALMLLARPGDDLTGAYPFSVYATGGFAGDPAYYGIRRAPYSVDPSINALSFRHMADRVALPTHHPIQPSNNNSEVHNAGEVWAAALWEAYVALQQAGGGTFEEIRAKMARYVVTGLSLTPIEASPMEARDAILAAALAASPADHATMIAAFARRGFGSCAIAPPDSSLDFIGIVESTVVAGNPQLAATAIVDECDEDNVLDTGETALVRATVVNQGHAPLTDLTFQVTSQLAGVRVLSPPSQLARLEPFATTDLEISVALDAGIADAIAGDLALQVSAAGGCAATIDIPIATRLNIDDVAVSSTVDSFDTLASQWSPWSIAWSHVRDTPLDGSWHAEDLPIWSDTSLTSPYLIAHETDPVVMTFTHRHSFEHSNGTAWDGGVIEVSADNGGTWTDVAALGHAGYNGTLTDESSNPLAGQLAYVATNPSWPEPDTVTIDLGTALAAQAFRVRFRVGTDGATGAHGWDLDDVGFTGIVGTPFSSQVADDGNCEPIVPPDDPIRSGGGGCCETGGSMRGGGVPALIVLLGLLGLRRRRR